MINEWHGYPQHPDAHPERPWWRREFQDSRIPECREWAWIRTDSRRGPSDMMRGAMLRDALDRIDKENPLPAPEPRCGQVWLCVDPSLPSPVEDMVVGIERMGATSLVRWGTRVASTGVYDPQNKTWPTPNAVLVAGPGSPWAPMGDTK